MRELKNAPGLSAPPGYSHVATAAGGRLVVTAGAVPLDADGALVGADDYVAQAERALANLARALDAAGATGEDVLKTTVYVASSERRDLTAVWEVVQRWPVAAAASTLLGVATLGYDGQLVEVEAIAVVA
jgi:enamine deaminase RidA (YjgF/YER057c/UK114 family)